MKYLLSLLLTVCLLCPLHAAIYTETITLSSSQMVSDVVNFVQPSNVSQVVINDGSLAFDTFTASYSGAFGPYPLSDYTSYYSMAPTDVWSMVVTYKDGTVLSYPVTGKIVNVPGTQTISADLGALPTSDTFVPSVSASTGIVGETGLFTTSLLKQFCVGAVLIPVLYWGMLLLKRFATGTMH